MRSGLAFIQSSPQQEDSGSPRSLFHDAWYVHRYGKTVLDRGTAWDHFTEIGEREGYMPHPLFVPTWYSKVYDVSERPLWHYAEVGRRQGFKTHPLYSPVNADEDIHEISKRDPANLSYLLEITTETSTCRNSSSLLNYLLSSPSEIRFPNPWFDRVWYSQRFEDAISPYGDALTHYQAKGGHSGLPTGEEWDWRVYIQRYPDVLFSSLTPLEHFLLHGKSEHRRPSRRPIFSAILKMIENRDAEQALLQLKHVLGWTANDVDIIEYDTSRSTQVLEPGSAVRRIGEAFLLKRPKGITTLVGNPGLRHSRDHYLIVGKWIALPKRDEASEKVSGIPLPNIADQPTFELAINALALALDSQVPLMTTRSTQDRLKSLEQMGLGFFIVDAANPAEFVIPELKSNRASTWEKLRCLLARVLLNSGTSMRTCAPSFIRYLEMTCQEEGGVHV